MHCKLADSIGSSSAACVDPSHLPAYRNLASELLDADRLDEADEVVRRGLVQCADALGVGWLDYMLGEIDLARAIDEVGGHRVASENDQYFISFAVEHGSAFRSEHARSAAAAFERAIDRLGSPIRGSYIQLAAAHTLAGDHAAALAAYRQLFEVEEYKSRARGGSAHSLIQLGRYSEAIDILRPLLEEMPDTYELRNMYAISLLEVGELDAAGIELKRLALTPNAPAHAWPNFVTWCIRTASWDDLKCAIRSRCDARPQDLTPLHELHELGRRKGDLAIQAESLEGILLMRPEDSTTRLALACVELRRAQFSRAIEHFERVPSDLYTPHWCAAFVGALGHAGRWDDAKRVAALAVSVAASGPERARCTRLLELTLSKSRVTLDRPGGVTIPGDLLLRGLSVEIPVVPPSSWAGESDSIASPA